MTLNPSTLSDAAVDIDGEATRDEILAFKRTYQPHTRRRKKKHGCARNPQTYTLQPRQARLGLPVREEGALNGCAFTRACAAKPSEEGS